MRSGSEAVRKRLLPAASQEERTLTKKDPVKTIVVVDDAHFVKDVQMPMDIYNATIAAAFGGVQIDLASSSRKRGATSPGRGKKLSTGQFDGSLADKMDIMNEDEYIQVHPGWVFLLSLPLAAAQAIFLMALCVDADLVDTIYDDTPNGHSLLVLKCFLVVTLQVMVFQEMLETLASWAFCINPTSWMDCYRASYEGTRFALLWTWPSLLIPSLCAVLLKFGIAYLVTVESVSIILQAKSVQQALFNSLALTFIIDLDTKYWGFCSKVFRLEVVEWEGMDVDDDEKFHFFIQRGPPHAAPRTEDEESRCCYQCREEEWNSPESPLYKTLSRRDFGWRHVGGRQLERWATFGVLFAVYRRQVSVICYAVYTKILPLTRDTCSYLWWASHKANSEQSKLVRAYHWLRYTLMAVVGIDLVELLEHPPSQLEGDTSGANLTSFCLKLRNETGGLNVRMSAADAAKMRDALGWRYWLVIVSLALIVLVPQFFGLLKRAFLQLNCSNKGSYDDDEEDSEE